MLTHLTESSSDQLNNGGSVDYTPEITTTTETTLPSPGWCNGLFGAQFHPILAGAGVMPNPGDSQSLFDNFRSDKIWPAGDFE